MRSRLRRSLAIDEVRELYFNEAFDLIGRSVFCSDVRMLFRSTFYYSVLFLCYPFVLCYILSVADTVLSLWPVIIIYLIIDCSCLR